MNLSVLRVNIEELIQAQVEQRVEIEELSRKHRREMDRVLNEVFEIADGVARSRAAATPEDLVAVLSAISRQIDEALLDLDITSFHPAVGEGANGLSQDFMATVSNPALQAGTVTRVIRDGYRQGDRVIRRAGVEVVKE